jgi:small subunit ribosomal protein S6
MQFKINLNILHPCSGNVTGAIVRREVNNVRQYEIMYILRPDLEEEAREAAIAKVNDLIVKNGGEITKSDVLGKKKLAYEVKDYREGVYVLTYFQVAGSAIAEIERVLKITDDVIKYLLVLKAA